MEKPEGTKIKLPGTDSNHGGIKHGKRARRHADMEKPEGTKIKLPGTDSNR